MVTGPEPAADGADARRRLAAQGQQHLIAHAATLPPSLAATFLNAAAAEPWEALRAAALHPAALRPAVGHTTVGHRATPDSAEVAPEPPALPELRPPVALTWRRQQAVGGLRSRLAAQGRSLLTQGRVAALLLAGGQGTRLGLDGPKGCFVLGPRADRTLYAIHAERVGRVSRAAGRPIPLVVLTSPETDAATRTHFADGGDFGLEPGQLRCLTQDTLPVLDPRGRALLVAPGRLARAPDGHGGAWPALLRAGVLDEWLAAGVQILTTFQVDNPLARPLDPVLLGWLVERRAQALGKAVRKTAPEEQVGVYARDLDGRTRVVEYSDLAGAGGAAGLTLGSVAVHAFDLAWLTTLLRSGREVLPLHAARKSVVSLPIEGPLTGALPGAALPGGALPNGALPNGALPNGALPNGGAGAAPQAQDAIKLERFLFDVLPWAGRAEVLEVERTREFAPIKNAEGPDSPATARALVAAEVRRWHRARGLPEPAEPALEPLQIDDDGSEEPSAVIR